MGIKQKAFQPLAHQHTIDQVILLQDKLNETQYEQNGVVGRRYAPFCRVLLGSNFWVNNATDTWLGGLFTTTHDNAGMVKHPGSGGAGDDTRLRLIIPISGFYQIEWKYYINNVGSTVCNAAVTLNNVVNVTTGALIMAQGASSGWSSPTAIDTVYLTAGDRIYFAMWHNAGGSREVFASWFGTARTSITARWVGR